MTTNKFLIGSTLVFVIGLLIGGLYFPDTLVMSLAGTTTAYAVLRGIIIVLLISLLVTHPPRSRVLRTLIGTFSIGLSVISLQLLLNYQINLLDMILFMELAVIFGIEALESRRVIPVNQKHTPARRIPVYNT